MNKLLIQLSVVLVSLLASLACAPKTTPMPTSTAPPPPPPTSVTATGGSADAEWARVVEAAQKEGKLIAYNYFYSGEVGATLVKAFKEKYGITIESVFGSAPTNVERIKAERAAGKDSADIFETTVTGVWALKDAGLLVPVGSLPVLREKGVWQADPISDSEGTVLLYGMSMMLPWINTNLVKPGEEPKSYRELIQPKWKGKLTMIDPRLGIAPVLPYVTLRRVGTLDDAYFVALAKQDIKWAGPTDAENTLARGEAYVQVPSSDGLAAPLVVKGASIKPVDAEEGAVVVRSPGIGVLKYAPHPNAAKVFVNWLLSPEGQIAFHKNRGGKPIRKDAPNFLPPSVQLEPKKPFISTRNDEVEGARVVQTKELAKLMGLEK